MKNYFLRTAGILLLFPVANILFTDCTSTQSGHFITDADYRTRVRGTLEMKKTYFADPAPFDVFDREMTLREREALEFLYAYMPVGDIADYGGDFYLRNVRASFETREEMPWGKDIPEMIFRHFVLPVRVNSENLDESRTVFYGELKERVRNLSLYDAVLEVNHWCHEKVIYTPSDGRTSSPLASVRSAYGRCGEESTFTVAALRSVGIPARQVYTPRWAHTDDNHAWVEAWVDGKWYFMGACEPEPALNLGWFNAPASRGMLMHTKVFGYYDGAEDVMERTGCYTEINVIDHYAPTALANVTVRDVAGAPVEGALVEFKLYNYAEFYSVAQKTTDRDGRCSLSAGKGDMLVWATKDGRFGYHKISFGKDDHLTVVLDKSPGDTATLEFDITPPVEGGIPVEVTGEQRKENEKRLREEDAVRNRYVSTFYTKEKALAAVGKYPAEMREKAAGILVKSRGNHAQIEKFLSDVPDGMMSVALSLLDAVSNKDLRDTPAEIFADHFYHTPIKSESAPCPPALFYKYVLNPRVSNELLTPYKKFFAENMDISTAENARKNPQVLVDWVKENIIVRDSLNPQRIPVMPAGVWKARTADTHSRNIFFVALARSLSIPARIEPVAKKVQYYDGKWVDVNFDADGRTVSERGYVAATYNPIKSLENPKYSTHFTLSKLRPDARLQTLNFDSGSQTDMGGGDTWTELLRRPLAIDEGYYMLTSGTRMASGKVLARITFFTVEKDKTASVALVMRENTDDIRVIGSIDAEAKFRKAENGEETSILDATGRGYFIIGILGPRQEPTNHAMRDIAGLKEDFEKWNRGIILLFKNGQSLDLFDRNEFGALPATVACGVDTDGRITKMIADAVKLSDSESLPIFVIADTFGRVVFVSQGYTIGLGEQLMKTIHAL
ncbi:MAG: transglutaminase-like domain-containing protein [Tannerella sp.]|jgi:transglutaminase-like putative cysteine protease|nr:transglutaminase-like domain-containing protein [Tannerella sp.]